MTLQSSGAISISDINEELGYTAGATLTIGDTIPRWLADTPSGAISLSDFHDKTAVKIVDSATATSSGSSHTFTGVDFGTAFTGRVLVACVGLYIGTTRALDQTSCTIGGESATGGDAGTASAASCGAGQWAASVDSGTSGNVFIDWAGTGGSVSVSLVLLSVPNISTTPHDETTNWNSGGTGKTTSLDIPAGGVLIMSHAHANTNETSWSGVTERFEATFGGARHSVGFDTQMDEETGRTITATWSGDTAAGGEARSYS